MAGCCVGRLSHPTAANQPPQPCVRWGNKVAFNQREVKPAYLNTRVGATCKSWAGCSSTASSLLSLKIGTEILLQAPCQPP